ncbi:MAG: TFIIB-type zinc ribbon-containing protein [Candidatus Nitrosopolaris sp.]|jgi:transcription initiation factor TFIIB
MERRNIICSVCKSDRVITDYESGEVICSNCGLVISDNIQDSTDAMYDKSRKTGVTNSLARYDMGLSTIMGKSNQDAGGHILDAAMRSRMERLRRWDLRIKTSTYNNRNLRDAFDQLHTSKDKLGLPDSIVEKTAYIYRKAQQRGLVRGRAISAVLDAAMYIACRELGIPKTLKEIAVANNTKRRTLAKSYRLLITELDIKIPIIDSTKCIIKISNTANLNEKTKRKAINIMYDLNRKEVPAGKDPMGIAATVLYIACLYTGEKRTQTDIAQAAGVTEVTLRNRYRQIKRLELDLVPIVTR